MINPNRPHDPFGVSWGTRGFRIGRSQYGTWWISIALPFGIRISRRLGTFHRKAQNAHDASESPREAPNQLTRSDGVSGKEPAALTPNQEVLEKIRATKK